MFNYRVARKAQFSSAVGASVFELFFEEFLYLAKLIMRVVHKLHTISKYAKVLSCCLDCLVLFFNKALCFPVVKSVQKSHLLNSDGKVSSLRRIVYSNQADNSTWFIRPNLDTKAFSGIVMRFVEIKA
jgi:hypothetical protein